MSVHEALEPPADAAGLLKLVPELGLARELEQSPFHHLDTFDHILEVIHGTEREISASELGARISRNRIKPLRIAALLHDVAKPITRGDIGGKVLFIAHDSLGAGTAYHVCRRLDLPAIETDLAATLTHLHLKIGFMDNPRSDYPPDRLVRAAGPFGEELAVLSWADRLAAQGPRLKEEHIERHRRLCLEFLRASRERGPHPVPNYEDLAEKLSLETQADAGHAASRLRLLQAGGLDAESAIGYVTRTIGAGSKTGG